MTSYTRREWWDTQGYAPQLYHCLKKLIADIDDWNEAVESVIGRQPETTWGDLEEARELIARIERSANEAKGER